MHMRSLRIGMADRWTLISGAGLVGIVVALSGAQAAPAKDEPKREEKKEEKKGLDRQIDDALKELEKAAPPAVDEALPDGRDPLRDPLRLQRELREALQKLHLDGNQDLDKQVQEIQKIQKQMIEQMQRQIFQGGRGFGGALPGRGLNGLARPFGGIGSTGRLGVRLQALTPVMVEQLDLPAEQGLIVAEVNAGSPAEKAGLKKHDILLEFGGAKVPNQIAAFQNQVRGIKADEAVDAVVVRKGKREAVKGIKLGEANDGFGGAFDIPQAIPLIPNIPNFPFPNVPPGGGGKIQLNLNGNGATTAITRNNDEFSIEQAKPGLKLSIKGKVENGKAIASEIVIQEGDTTVRSATLEQVPEKHRDDVERLVRSVR